MPIGTVQWIVFNAKKKVFVYRAKSPDHLGSRRRRVTD
jgi:hypothetical protein